MATVQDRSGNNPLDLKYSPANRTAADISAVLALTPLYPGEIVKALNTGRNYRAVGATTWGLIGPVTSVVAGTLPQPSVTINQAAGQADPVGSAPIQFTVQFTQDVTGFATGDVSFAGSTVGGTLVGAVGGGPNLYTVTVTGMTTTGSVIASVPAGVAIGAGGTNLASTSTDNTVQWVVDTTPPSVVASLNPGQTDPSPNEPFVQFRITFSEPVIGFTAADVSFAGTTAGTLPPPAVTGGPTVYTLGVVGMTTAGNILVTIPAGVCTDAAGNPNTASNTVTLGWLADTTRPSVTINKAAGQADPTSTSPIVFTIVFSEPVSGFIASDLTGSGPGTLSVNLSGSGANWTAQVIGMSGDGNVTLNVPANVCQDAAGNLNFASTSTDNVVQWIEPVAPGGVTQTYFYIAGQY